MNIAKLVTAALKRQGPTRAARLAAHAERSRVFNAMTADDFEKQKVTPELLAKRCTL